MTPGERTHRIGAQARQLGFDLCGVAPATKFPELENLSEWLGRGYAGEMRYLHNPKRQSPELVLAGARSVIVCAMNYNTPLSYSIEARAATLSDPEPRGWISRYAWGDDYHDVLGERLEKLVAWMRGEFAEPHDSRWYVDTGPIVERVAAKWAGLGWLGKNTCLINEEMGSWLFLSVVVTTLELQPSLEMENGKGKMEKGSGTARDAATLLHREPRVARGESPVTSHESPATPFHSLTPAPDLCGQCTLCIDACPTGALVEPYVLDARRCISYLTIELRGEIPSEFHKAIGWHIFGCDICQDVCPFNRNAPATGKRELQPRGVAGERGSPAEKSTLFAPVLPTLHLLDEPRFATQFEHSPLRRTKHAGLRRNIHVAITNGGKL